MGGFVCVFVGAVCSYVCGDQKVILVFPRSLSSFACFQKDLCILFYVHESFACHVHMCNAFVSGFSGGQKRVSGPLELELQM